jgi:hypothetical protein
MRTKRAWLLLAIGLFVGSLLGWGSAGIPAKTSGQRIGLFSGTVFVFALVVIALCKALPISAQGLTPRRIVAILVLAILLPSAAYYPLTLAFDLLPARFARDVAPLLVVSAALVIMVMKRLGRKPSKEA